MSASVTTAMDVLWGPKAGCPIEDCRDIAVLDEALRNRGGRVEARAALCDGTTVGFDTGRWATMLGDAVVDSPTTAWTAPGFAELVDELAEEWRDNPPDFASLYHEEAWRRGAATTLAAFAIEPRGRHGVMRCIAIGDSAVVIVRRDGAVRCWPELDPSSFTTTPDLVTTTGVCGTPVLGRARLDPGDQVIAVSDAVAQWALAAHAAGRPAWTVLARVDPARFDELIDRLRNAGELEDDDVSVVRATIRMEIATGGRRRIRSLLEERV